MIDPPTCNVREIALSKRMAGKISRRNGKLLLIERAQVIGEQADLLQVCRSCCDLFPDCREFGELGERLVRMSRKGSSRRRNTFASPRDGCATQTQEFHLIFFIQRPSL